MFGRHATSRRAAAADALVGFLVARLTEELAALWERGLARERDGEPDGGRPGPGLVAQLEVLDALLLALRSGRLPGGLELRLLLHAYSGHPDYDPSWAVGSDTRAG